MPTASSARAGRRSATEANAHAIRVDPSGRFAFAACLGGGVMRQMRFDAVSGRLDANDPPAWHARPGAGPRHFVIHPTLALVYLLNELDASIDVLDIDRERGVLRGARQTVSALPSGVAVGAPWAADLHLTSDGRFLYASERRSSTLAAFAVDASTGALAPIGSIETEAEPRGFAITPDGRSLLVVGQASHRLARYAIDPTSGALSKRSTQAGRHESELGRDRRSAGVSAVVLAVAGLAVLAVAMGIGRFAFTPILPMMLHDGVVDLHAASWLASANYLGYLTGAVLCTLQPRIWRQLPRLPAIDAPSLTRAGLVMTTLLTLGMALPVPVLWPALRFAAGVASALVFVYASTWCLAQIAARGQPALGGLMFVGPGLGIVASGLLASAMVAVHWKASAAWIVFAALALILSAAAWRVFRPGTGATRSAVDGPSGASGDVSATVAIVADTHSRAEVATLAVAYGLAGFGYIVTATFLPVIARSTLAGSAWLDLFWPIFGVGVILGALIATRVRVAGDLRVVLAATYVIQAVGIGIGLLTPTIAGFAIGSFLLGLPFTAITYFAMQEVRRLRPLQMSSTTGLVTVVWSLGQALGPSMVALLLQRITDVDSAFTLALMIAAGVLVLGALIHVTASRIWPLGSPKGKAFG